jgi:hypothetical protein
MTTDDLDNGWDSLAEDLGLQPDQTHNRPPVPVPDEPAAPARPARRAPILNRAAEDDLDEFGLGVEEPAGAARPHPALYDPGPEAVVDDLDEAGEAPAPLDDEDEGGDEEEAFAPGDEEGPPGGKKRRRRRRRKKKGSGPADEAEAAPAGEDENGALVEEGEAPAEVEDDEEDAFTPSAVDEEMDAEVAHPRPEYHVMTWAELVSRLHRPG